MEGRNRAKMQKVVDFRIILVFVDSKIKRNTQVLSEFFRDTIAGIDAFYVGEI